MAYSNWGATVHVDGQAMHVNCDITPKRLLERQPYQHYMQHYLEKTEEDSPMNRMFHAVIGDSLSGILVCLYKDYASSIIVLHDPPEFIDAPDCYDEDAEVTVDGIKLEFWHSEGPNAISCEFTDKQGREWVGVSGYCMGEGHQEWA